MIRKVHLKDKRLIPFVMGGYRKMLIAGVPTTEKRIYFEGDKEIDLIRMVHGKEGVDVIVLVDKGADTEVVTKEQVLGFVRDQRGIKLSGEVLKKIENLSDDDFLVFIKMSCCMKHWYTDIFKRKESVYSLFKASSRGVHEFIETLLKLEETTPIPVLFSSFVTFLTKVSSYDEIMESLGDNYRIQVRRAKNQFAGKIKEELYKLVLMDSSIDLRVRLLSFFTGLLS